MWFEILVGFFSIEIKPFQKTFFETPYWRLYVLKINPNCCKIVAHKLPFSHCLGIDSTPSISRENPNRYQAVFLTFKEFVWMKIQIQTHWRVQKLRKFVCIFRISGCKYKFTRIGNFLCAFGQTNWKISSHIHK